MRFRFELRADRTGADGTAPLYLRITHHRRLYRVATGIRLAPADWNDRKQEVRRSHPLAKALNTRLRDLLIEAQRLSLEHPNDPEAVRAALKGPRGDVLDFARCHIERLTEQGRYWEQRKYQTLLRKLYEVFHRLDWEDLTPRALERFEQQLRTKWGNAPSTIYKEMTRLSRLVRLAIREGLLPRDRDPFQRYEMPRPGRPVRRKLTLEEIRALEALELPEGSRLALYRDVFLFCVYAGGMRFGDAVSLRREAIGPDGWLRYTQMKTGARVELPLVPPALEIVRRWERSGSPFVFPLLEPGDDADPWRLRRRIAPKNTLANRYLKQIARRAGLAVPEEITTHTARHSFADAARRASGDVFAVSRALGHTKLSTTQRYLSELDRDAVARLIETVWGHEKDT